MIKKIIFPILFSIIAMLISPMPNSGLNAHEMSHHGMHSNDLFEADMPYPTMDIELSEDAMSGFNLKINLKNFQFSPETVNLENNGNIGHAHLYVNGQKFRLYSQYYHISGDLLKSGDNEIKVTINSNDHRQFSKDGEPIQVVQNIVKSQ